MIAITGRNSRGRSNFIFPTLSKEACNFSEKLATLSLKVGIRRTTAHCIRHSVGTILMTSGEHNVQQVQKQLGHSDPKMTFNYYDASYQSTLPMMETMNALIGRISSQHETWDNGLVKFSP
jgi:integrase